MSEEVKESVADRYLWNKSCYVNEKSFININGSSPIEATKPKE